MLVQHKQLFVTFHNKGMCAQHSPSVTHVQLHACRLYHFTMQLRSSWFDPMRSLSWLRTNVTLTSCMLISMLLSVLLSVPPEAPLGALLVMLLSVLLGVLLVMLLQLLQRGKWLVHMAQAALERAVRNRRNKGGKGVGR